MYKRFLALILTGCFTILLLPTSGLTVLAAPSFPLYIDFDSSTSANPPFGFDGYEDGTNGNKVGAVWSADIKARDGNALNKAARIAITRSEALGNLKTPTNIDPFLNFNSPIDFTGATAMAVRMNISDLPDRNNSRRIFLRGTIGGASNGYTLFNYSMGNINFFSDGAIDGSAAVPVSPYASFGEWVDIVVVTDFTKSNSDKFMGSCYVNGKKIGEVPIKDSHDVGGQPSMINAPNVSLMRITLGSQTVDVSGLVGETFFDDFKLFKKSDSVTVSSNVSGTVGTGRPTLELNFDGYLVEETIRENITLVNTSDNSEVSGIEVTEVKHFGNSNYTTASVKMPRLEPDTNYRFVFKSDFKDIFGVTPSGSVSFRTKSGGQSFEIIASTPSNGAELADNFASLSFTFDKELNPSTLNPDDFCLFPGNVGFSTVSLLNDDTVLRLISNEPLKTSTVYTLSFPDALRDMEGIGINPSMSVFTFKTGVAPDRIRDELDSLAVGTNGVAAFTSTLAKVTATPELFLQDQTRYALDGADFGEIVYRSDTGIRNASVKVFEAESGAQANVRIEESADNATYTVCQPQKIKDAEQPGISANAAAYSYELSLLSPGTKYVKVILERPAGTTGALSFSQIRSVELNGMNPGDNAVVSSTPVDGNLYEKVSNVVRLQFKMPLYRPSVSAASFAFSPAASVRDVDIDAVGLATIVLDSYLQPYTQYTLNYSGIKDLYGETIAGSIAFKTGSPLLVTDISLLSSSTSLNAVQNGELTPQFRIRNTAAAAENITLFAFVYENGEMKQSGIKTLSIPPGVASFSMDNLTVTDKDNTVIRMFAWNNASKMHFISNVYVYDAASKVVE